MTEQTQEETYTVVLPDHIGEQIEHRIERTQFDSHEEYVIAVLEEFLAAIDDQGETDTKSRVETDASAGLEDQLESLGYL